MSDIHAKVKAQFSKVASAYVTSSIHAKGEDLNVLLELAADVSRKTVLDIATGGGHTALAFAKAGAKVTATDLTKTMLDTAKAFIEEQGFTDIVFQEAAAEALPFDTGSFDVVTCRIAPHHFADPAKFVSEVSRVLKPSGSFLLIDNITPEDSVLADSVNHIEKTRDSSHVAAYSVRTWLNWLADNHLELHYLTRFERKKDYQTWARYAQASEETISQLERYVLSLPEAIKRYLTVEVQEGKLRSLTHEVVLLHAKKQIIRFKTF